MFGDDSRLSHLVKRITKDSERDRRLTAVQQLEEFLNNADNHQVVNIIITIKQNIRYALYFVYVALYLTLDLPASPWYKISCLHLKKDWCALIFLCAWQQNNAVLMMSFSLVTLLFLLVRHIMKCNTVYHCTCTRLLAVPGQPSSPTFAPWWQVNLSFFIEGIC